jgi:hypothetical protein
VGSVRGRGKAAGANAETATKAVTRARRSAQPRKQIEAKTAGKWKLIPSHQACLDRLAAEPGTTVVLSAEEAEWRREAERAASEDPLAYLKSCR